MTKPKPTTKSDQPKTKKIEEWESLIRTLEHAITFGKSANYSDRDIAKLVSQICYEGRASLRDTLDDY